ncbi:fructose-6-phosphate aldolase [Lacticigenium naphthae]|uniref:fructose-6-phosphate aldolase n=1 Tax=Lacticigenium naphthae TaxID=515351 RepID=UPI00040A6DF2|nr:fructose-6-phosphate aldolase [Lacticigenium naphthae]
MEFLLDTANLEEINYFKEVLPLSGITSNPSIIKKEGKVDFFVHMNKIRELIGIDRSLHIQVVSQNYEGMMKDAETILKQVDEQVFIKVPVTEEGLKAIQALKRQGKNVTATAIYTKIQAYYAIAAKVDYLAPYYNRMENLNIDPNEAIQEMRNEIQRTGSTSKILAASFKNVGQVTKALEAGAHAATFSAEVAKQSLDMPSISLAVANFTADWEAVYGEDMTITDLFKSVN